MLGEKISENGGNVQSSHYSEDELVVLILKIPRMEQTSDQMEEVNCVPQSEVRRAGNPNLDIHV